MMKREQIRVLNTELNRLGYISTRNVAQRRHPKSATVKRAEKIVAQHERTVQRERSKIDKKYRQLRDRARKAIYFGTEREALAAVRKVAEFHARH
jgi:Skp family chaperone for outer membrane proteins